MANGYRKSTSRMGGTRRTRNSGRSAGARTQPGRGAPTRSSKNNRTTPRRTRRNRQNNLSGYVISSTGRPYSGFVIMRDGIPYSTKTGAFEGSSVELTFVGKGRTPVMTDCPPGLLTCPDGSCVEDLNNCPYVNPGEPGSGQYDMPVGCPPGFFRCWDNSCAQTINQCPTNPNFNPGEGEFGPNNQLGQPRVPGSNIGQCYCECAKLNQPENIIFSGMLGSCSHPGQHCDAQCTEYCNSQVFLGSGEQNMQFSFSQCYDMT